MEVHQSSLEALLGLQWLGFFSAMQRAPLTTFVPPSLLIRRMDGHGIVLSNCSVQQKFQDLEFEKEKDSCLIYVQIYIIKLRSINFNRYLSFAFWRRELSPPSSAHFQKREVKQLLLVLLKFHRRRRYALCRGPGMYKILVGTSFVVAVIFQPP